MTAYSADAAQNALTRLRRDGVIAPIDPMQLGGILTGYADEYAALARELEDARERLLAIRQAVFPHLRDHDQRGGLARTVEAEADPHPEPDPA